MSNGEGGRVVPPASPPLAAVRFSCPMCGWAVRYPISEGDLTGNRGVCLWVRCAGGCGGYAFMAGVYPGDWKPDVPVGIVNYADAREAALFATLGIRWEDA